MVYHRRQLVTAIFVIVLQTYVNVYIYIYICLLTAESQEASVWENVNDNGDFQLVAETTSLRTSQFL